MTTMDYYHARCGKNNKSKCAQRHHQLSLSLGRLVVASYVAGFMSATVFFSFFAHLGLPGQQQQQLESRVAPSSSSSSSSPTLLKELFSTRRRDECEISLGKFKGRTYTSVEGGTVGRPKCLIESKFLKVQLHQVQFPGSATLIRDWLFIDYHDRINVLVQAPPTGTNNKKSNNDEDDGKTTPPHFWVFEQTKYALESRTSLAIVGGIVEPGEEPQHAAVREVREEMGVTCDRFHPLGRFRTDVNRGVGWTNSYLATGCSKLPPQEATITTATVNKSKDHHPSSHKEEDEEEVVGAADAERQDLRTLSIHELRDAVRGGRFIEVQWTATVAVALHHPALLLSDEVS